MNKALPFLLNLIFFSIVVLIAFSVATIALTRKVNETRTKYNQGIKGTVIKHVMPILSYAQAITEKVYVKSGDEIKKDQLLVTLDNEVLKRKIATLNQYPDNVSAQTEAKVAEEELKNLKIYSPVDAIVGDIDITEGLPIESFKPVMTIYSNKDIRVLAELTIEEYQEIRKLNEVKAYSPRLNQNFVLKPEILRPDAKTPLNFEEKKIGLYFTFKNPNYAKDLLHNEDLEIRVDTLSNQINKPVDLFVNFWNGMLAKNTTK